MKSKKNFIASAIAFCLVFPIANIGAEEKEQVIEFSGKAENVESFNLTESAMYSGMTSLELNLDARPGENSKIHAAIQANNIRGKIAEDLILAQTADINPSVLENKLYLIEQTKSLFFFDISSLYIAFWKGPFDFSIGKQEVRFGKGLIFSPLDIFCPPSLEIGNPREGAIFSSVASISFGNFSSIEGVAVFNTKLEEGTYALNYKTLLGSFEFISLGFYEGNYLGQEVFGGGLGFKGDLVFGIFGEALVRTAINSLETKIQGSLGIDYSFGRDFIFTLEYFYNEENTLLSEKHYLALACDYTITELASISAFFVSDLAKPNIVSTILFTQSIAQGTEVGIFASYSHQKESTIENNVEAGLKVTLYF